MKPTSLYKGHCRHWNRCENSPGACGIVVAATAVMMMASAGAATAEDASIVAATAAHENIRVL